MLRSAAAAVLAILILALAAFASDTAQPSSIAARPPELEYLMAVNRAAPPADPQLLFILMGQFANANRHGEGAEFLAERLREFEPRLTDVQKGLYMTAIAALRAGHAAKVPLLKRIGWINETVDMLEEAKRRTGGEVFVVRWIAGAVYTQLPGVLGKRDAALAELDWCLANLNKAPHAGWAREVYYRLAVLHREGDPARAEDYLRRSGYADFDKPVSLTTPWAEERASGHTFSSKRIAEVVPGKVYALSGFEFTEYYFIVSEDGRELIAVDAGTRPDSARSAYEALRARVGNLPPLTTVLVTHAHWDHVGGHRYFRSLNPNVKFYARANYGEELQKVAAAPATFGARFFGEAFSIDDVRSFRADATIEKTTELVIGGTRISAIPAPSGETEDAMFFHFPQHGVLFVGDFIMPYLGAPFVEEGNLDHLIEAIALVERIAPKHLLHGHEPLTATFSSVPMLTHLAPTLTWLKGEVLGAIRRGEERGAIHQANLIAPGLLAGDSRVHLPYLLLRENVINRIYDQNVGYWQSDLQGMDSLTRADRGALLVDYLGITEAKLSEAVDRLVADGKHELAASLLREAGSRYPGSATVRRSERLVYAKLTEKNADFNPFKFIIYSSRLGQPIPQMSAEGGVAPGAAIAAMARGPISRP